LVKPTTTNTFNFSLTGRCFPLTPLLERAAQITHKNNLKYRQYHDSGKYSDREWNETPNKLFYVFYAPPCIMAITCSKSLMLTSYICSLLTY